MGENPFFDYSELRGRAKRTGAPVGKQAKRGRACCDAADGACPAGAPKRPRYFCAGCAREREGCSGDYHWECCWGRRRPSPKLRIRRRRVCKLIAARSRLAVFARGDSGENSNLSLAFISILIFACAFRNCMHRFTLHIQ